MTGVVPKLRTAQDLTSKRKAGKRRGDNLPARLRFSARRGHTLVELMIGFLILTIVCLCWLEMMGFQNWTKESARREAVEQLHGMMDAFVETVNVDEYSETCTYTISFKGDSVEYTADNPLDYVSPLGLVSSPAIGYRMYLEPAPLSPLRDSGREYWAIGTKSGRYWLCGELYDECNMSTIACGRAFCKMKVFVGGK